MRPPPLTPMAWQRWAVVEPLLERVAPETVLEIGCGMGGIGARLAARFRYTGVEPDERSFATARTRIEAAGGRALPGTASDLAGETFDVVCAFEVLEHIEDDAAALRTWVQLVKPGGSLLISVPAGRDRFGPSDAHVGHFRRYDPEQIRDALERAGLADVTTRLYGWPLGLWTEAARNAVLARRGVGEERSMQSRTAGSGRWLQPGPVTGEAVRLLTLPFVLAQRTQPSRGVGLVALGRVPVGRPL